MRAAVLALALSLAAASGACAGWENEGGCFADTTVRLKGIPAGTSVKIDEKSVLSIKDDGTPVVGDEVVIERGTLKDGTWLNVGRPRRVLRSHLTNFMCAG